MVFAYNSIIKEQQAYKKKQNNFYPFIKLANWLIYSLPIFLFFLSINPKKGDNATNMQGATKSERKLKSL